MFKKLILYFTKFEIALWLFSIISIIACFMIFDSSSYFTMISSIIGVTSIILCSKGNYYGEILMVIFSILYCIISYFFRYFSEIITYAFMTLPMSVLTYYSWSKNQFKEGKNEVKLVGSISKKDTVLLIILTVIVTFSLHILLKIFNTRNLIVSTISLPTSFVAVFLSYKRNYYFAFWYALNDVVLIVLWFLASLVEVRYVSVMLCFIIFLVNDTYCFINLRKIHKNQEMITNQ